MTFENRTSLTLEEVYEIFNSEDLAGVESINNDDGGIMPDFSLDDGGRYWFNDTWPISLRLLCALIIFGHYKNNEPLEVTEMSVEKAQEICNSKPNLSFCLDETDFPVVKNDSIYLILDCNVNELEAIYNLAIISLIKRKGE